MVIGFFTLIVGSQMRPGGWWLLPAFALMLVMVFAMMECSATLIGRPAPRSHTPVERDELLRRLQALDAPGGSYHLVPAGRADLQVEWDPIDPAWRARFARVKLTTLYHARMLLDEERHEVRWFEYVRSSSFFIGFIGWRLRISWAVWVKAGYMDVQWSGLAYGMLPGFPPRVGEVILFRLDTVALKQRVRSIASASGWAFRPRLWWFQVRRRPDGTVPRSWIPTSTRWWSEKQFWGVVYPVLYVVAMGYVVTMAGGWAAWKDPAVLLPVLGMTAVWWLLWGAIAWILVTVSSPRPKRGAKGSR